jgi:hypothetical protein
MLQEIQMHPVIRAKVREIVKRIAVVSTEPTEAGELMLTPFHKYGSVKRIQNKPVYEMLDQHAFDQYLFMVAAEKEGLITVCYYHIFAAQLLTSNCFAQFLSSHSSIHLDHNSQSPWGQLVT